MLVNCSVQAKCFAASRENSFITMKKAVAILQPVIESEKTADVKSAGKVYWPR